MADLHAPMYDRLGENQSLIIAVSVSLMAVSAIGIGLRLYARLAVLRKIFTEDVLMVLGAIAATGFSSIYVLSAYHGFGKHTSQTEVPSSDLDILGRASFAVIALYIIASLLVKTSFLVLYIRLDQRKPMRATVYVLMFLVAAQNTSFFVVQAIACTRPIFLTGESGHCWSSDNVQKMYNINGIAIAVLDTAIFVVPLLMLHGLSMPQRQKSIVGALFALGILPIAAGGARCYYLWDAFDGSQPWHAIFHASIWAQVELHLAILCGSASTFKVLLRGFGLGCCTGDERGEESLENLGQRGIVELPAGWRGQVKEISSAAESPVGGQGSFRTWTPPPSSSSGEKKRTASVKRLSGILLNNRPPSNVSRVPADVQLRFPSIDSRLGGGNSWMQEPGPTFQHAGQRWSLIQKGSF